MAEVYLARDQLLDRPVAVKVLFPALATDGLRRALPPGGAGGRQPPAPQHRQRVRLGRGQRHLLHRHGVRRGPHAGRDPAGRGPPPPRPRRRDHGRHRRRARLRPPQRRGPPGREARQRAHHPRRRRQGGRLRHRPGHQRLVGPEPHQDGLGHGHGDLLLARAGPRRAGRPPQRPVQPGRRALRDDHRPAAVRRRQRGGHRLQARAGEPGPAPARRPVAARDARGHHPQDAGQEPGQPLPVRPGPAGRPAPLPRRQPHPGRAGAGPAHGPGRHRGHGADHVRQRDRAGGRPGAGSSPRATATATTTRTTTTRTSSRSGPSGSWPR